MSTLEHTRAAGRRAASILAAVGGGLALAFIAVIASFDRDLVVDGVRRGGLGFAIAAVALFVLARWGGGRLARPVDGSRWLACLRGAVFAEFTLLFAALVAAGTTLLFESRPFVFGVAIALVDGIVKPITWAALFGSLPALALGATFPRTARRCLDSRRPSTPSAPAPPPD